MIFRIFAVSIFVFLAGCAGLDKPDLERSSALVPFSPPALDLDASLTELDKLRQRALKNKYWVEYILLTEELWLQSRPDQREAIEQDAWIALQAVTIADEAELLESNNRQVEQWGWLLEARKDAGLNFTRALEDIQQLAPNASFNSHLIPQLIEFYDSLTSSRTLALILPFSGEYSSISRQIKNGFLRAYWHSNTSHKLLFIDTNSFSSSLAAYEQAKKLGADLVLGPLTPAELYALQGQGITDLIALNSLDNETSFMQFSLRSQTEAQQLVSELMCQDIYRLGVLGSSASVGQEKLKQNLVEAWPDSFPYLLASHSFSQRNANLRQEMSYLINASFSQERASFLSRTIESPIEFFPRTRKDLDALVLLGDEKQLSVLRPQLDYFDLNLPVYATSNLNTDNLMLRKTNRDLKNIVFPTAPISLERSPLTTSTEALGWDAFYLGVYQPLLAQGLHLNGALGKHEILHNNRVATRMVWAKFKRDGSIVPLRPNKYSRLNLGPSDADKEVRRQLLENIVQPRLLDLDGAEQ